MGYGFAGTCHWKPFIQFCTGFTPSKHGNLVMRDDEVFSYKRKIAHVDRDNKHILFDETKLSRTTTVHQDAVRYGFNHLRQQGWTLEQKYFG